MDGTVGIGNGVVKQRQGFFQAFFVFLYANGIADQKSRHPPADPVFRMIMPAGVDRFEFLRGRIEPAAPDIDVRMIAEGLDHILLDHGIRRSEEHTSELQSLMRNSYAVLCLKN